MCTWRFVLKFDEIGSQIENALTEEHLEKIICSLSLDQNTLRLKTCFTILAHKKIDLQHLTTRVAKGTDKVRSHFVTGD